MFHIKRATLHQTHQTYWLLIAISTVCYRHSQNSVPLLQVLSTQHGYTLFFLTHCSRTQYRGTKSLLPPPEPRRRAYTPNKDDTQNDVTFTAYSLQSTSKLHCNKFLKLLFTATTQRTARF